MNISRTSFRKPLLASALALAGLGIAGQANAAAYSYAYASLKDFEVLFTGDTTITDRNRQTTSQSNYNGALVSKNDGPITSGLSDVAQSYSGPASAPAENTWTQALTSTLGARSDARTEANATGSPVIPYLYNVSESNVNGPNGIGQETARNIGKVYFTVNTGTSNVGFNMSAAWNLIAYATDLASDAVSTAKASFTIKQYNGSTYVPISGLNTYSPFDRSTSAGPGTLVSSTDSQLTYLDFSNANLWSNLGVGSYLLDLSLVTTGLENSREVPEPATMSLLGAGLVGLAAARRRKAKAKAEAQA